MSAPPKLAGFFIALSGVCGGIRFDPTSQRRVSVGEPTGGSSGQPLMFQLPGGGLARICTKHDSFADGREFIGVGVQPDVPVPIDRSDIIAGRDRVMETAIERIKAGSPSN